MARKVLVLLGTRKGAFILESDEARRSWELRGPFCETWPMNHVKADPATGTIYGGGGNEWFGPAVWKSTDLGASWSHSSEGLAYEAGAAPVKTVWSVAPGVDGLYAGVEPAGLFHSEDGGRRWDSIEAGLPSSFGFPAAAHPRDPSTLYLVPLNGDSAGRFVPEGKAAVYRTQDGGASWEAKRQGLPQHNVFFGVLRQAMATDQLEPAGVYFGTNTGALYASADEGESWSCIAQHLPVVSSVETLVVDT